MQVSNLQKVLVWTSFYVHTIYFKEQSPTHCIEYTMSLLFKTVLTPPAIAPAMRDLKVYGSTGPGNQKTKPPTVSSKMLWKPIVWDISWERGVYGHTPCLCGRHLQSISPLSSHRVAWKRLRLYGRDLAEDWGIGSAYGWVEKFTDSVPWLFICWAALAPLWAMEAWMRYTEVIS